MGVANREGETETEGIWSEGRSEEVTFSPV